MAPDTASLDGRLADLGRRIAEARADVAAGASARRESGRPFPMLLLAAVVLVVAIVVGGLALAARDGGGGGEVGADRTPVSTAAGAAGAEVSEASEASEALPAATADEPAPPAPVAAPASAAPALEVRTITVAPGESFWSIAGREVSSQLGRAATNAEVTSWWATFVAANADRLVEPGNPNLVLTGQVLVAPGGG